MNYWIFLGLSKKLSTKGQDIEDARRYIVKPKKDWKIDIISYSILFVISLLAFILTDKFSIPYLGTFLFFFGFLGMITGGFFTFRAIMVYRHYEDLFKEEDVKKLKDKFEE